MPELVRLEMADFELSVWANDISRRQQVFHNTERKHGVQSSGLKIELSPPQNCKEIFIHQTDTSQVSTRESITSLEIEQPLFFENTLYRVEINFLINVSSANTTHKSHLTNDGFGFVPSRNARKAHLSGVINTGNDIGWFSLPVRYEANGVTKNFVIQFEVLPTKMNLHADIPAMYRAIDNEFPLWRFSAIGKTEQNVSRTNKRGNFPLLWLANFKALRGRFEHGLKIVTQAPHARLQTKVFHKKADRLKCRVSHRLSEKIREDVKNTNFDKRYQIEQKRLSVDTPENRFIKSVVQRAHRELQRIETLLRVARLSGEFKDISESYLDELQQWQKPLTTVLKQSFLKDVGEFTALSRDSLVLQQKTGYSTVYSVWQELKFYLDAFANQSTISMKSVAEIYEIWCFLEMRRLLINELGFEETTQKSNPLYLRHQLEYYLKDGEAGSFKFIRQADGVKAYLKHEPVIKNGNAELKSYAVTQKPDIMLELELPHTSKKLMWLFDAKYRIQNEDDRWGGSDDLAKDQVDRVPDDALNQMHRYRDALIRVSNNGLNDKSKSRPVVGAFALYPGYFDQFNETNRYAESIDEVGIGAFPLLPSSSDERYKNHWLKCFLEGQINRQSKLVGTGSTSALEESLYTAEPARIPHQGMTQALYNDLTLTASLGPASGRSVEYLERFRDGTARAYHMPVSTFGLRFKQHIAQEVRFLALMESHDSYSNIVRVWPIRRVRIVKRCDISIEQSGRDSSSNEAYYLFELGLSLKLPEEIPNNPSESFRASLKLTTLELLERASNFSQIEPVYVDALIQ